ncbi:immobilization antigen (macronuclear) [Tetrahymena thermophila SB210]|uniref:Immobilization antigen n=1 Tax=Tetrahymena thermophila (strain SB210) TaxID=312017 RepID=Q23J46_TETTS|nr:immobilization antigen [Tetrahymena thermophila SB210]EAR96658.2 immobilization antigen [Tetrahymena thermophila SB210]|eukprot:XP_001016903.2 immobilization antigen [Tetrahymena thermophila SB210]
MLNQIIIIFNFIIQHTLFAFQLTPYLFARLLNLVKSLHAVLVLTALGVVPLHKYKIYSHQFLAHFATLQIVAKLLHHIMALFVVLVINLKALQPSAALNIGQYYDPGTSACVASCPQDTQADDTYTCKPIPKPGNIVACGSSGSCSGCGTTPQIANLFTPVTGLICKMIDCSQAPPSYNGYVCQSCYQATGAIAALNIGNYYDPGTSACVASCPQGTKADNTNTCQIIKPGNNVQCGSGGSCSGCGATSQIVNLFTTVSQSSCKMIDCSQTPPSYNAYVCQSCYQVTGAIAALNIGNYYNPGTHACVTSCPQGTQADNTNTCQPIPTKPGNNISCGSSGSCSGCGTTSEIVNLFTPVSGSSCKVTDCSQTPTSYNSYVCQSCYQVTGAIPALNIGNYYDPGTNTCVAECPQGKVADINNTCQTPKTIIGKDVGCGTAASNGNAANCNLCGENSSIQNLFSYDSKTAGQNCQFKDCSTIPSTLNGWICNSCNDVEGSKIPVGLYFNGSTCVSTCSSGVATSQTVPGFKIPLIGYMQSAKFLTITLFLILRKYYNHGKKRKRVKSKIKTIENLKERTRTRLAIHQIVNFFKSIQN